MKSVFAGFVVAGALAVVLVEVFGVLVGALLQIGQGSLTVTILAFGAVLLATINIFGGFAVTRRMLGMFSKG